MSLPASYGAALALAQGRVPRSEGRLLLREASGASAATIAAFPERALAPDAAARYCDWLERRAAGEPVAYILGTREFYGRSFAVGPDVLIPRPDTEVLVQEALAHLPAVPAPRLLDLGTGSGAIAVTLALEVPRAQVTAVDASPGALAQALDNARALGAVNLRGLLGDWYAPVTGELFELIVSNPPYIAEDDAHLVQGDLRYEPRSALAAAEEGLRDLARIINDAPKHLVSGGWLLLEHGFEQGEAVRARLQARGFGEVSSCRDLAGHERVSMGRWI